MCCIGCDDVLTHLFHRPTAEDALKLTWLEEQLGPEERSRHSIAHNSGKTGEFTNYLAMKKLKKAALGCIAAHLTQADFGALEKVFRIMDSNNEGTITLEQLDEAVSKSLVDEKVSGQLQSLRRGLAISDDQKLNWRDFLAMTLDRNLSVREDNLKVAFEHFKHSDAHYLSLSDLSQIYGGEAQAREVMDLLDADGDGQVSYEDFRHALVESMDEMEDSNNNEGVDLVDFHIH
jgi:calcium-dependent protein kinase